MKQLTFDGVNDLFQHPRWGAVTKEQAAYLDTLLPKPAPRWGAVTKEQAAYLDTLLPKPAPRQKIVEMSTEMALQNERFIDQHSFSMH